MTKNPARNFAAQIRPLSLEKDWRKADLIAKRIGRILKARGWSKDLAADFAHRHLRGDVGLKAAVLVAYH